MTYKEKLQKEYPEKVHDQAVGGCDGCPHTHGYCDFSNTLCGKEGRSNIYWEHHKCTKCWNQTIPGTEEKKTKRLPPEKKEWKATYVQFSDYPSHREKVIYSTKYSEQFVHFATESGVYAWNDEHHTIHAGAPVKATFCECRTYRDERGELRTMYLDAPTIHHIEFEEVEVDA
jgi:hypothetical protein